MTTVTKNDDNMGKCACPKCPSYDDCMKKGMEEGKMEGLYCSPEVGKSACEIKQAGCICGTCPVQIEHELTGGYYCVSGAPKEA